MLVNGIMIDSGEARKGRVLYDYDATSTGELTVLSDQVIIKYEALKQVGASLTLACHQCSQI